MEETTVFEIETSLSEEEDIIIDESSEETSESVVTDVSDISAFDKDFSAYTVTEVLLLILVMISVFKLISQAFKGSR